MIIMTWLYINKLFDNENIDILCLQERWLHERNLDELETLHK